MSKLFQYGTIISSIGCALCICCDLIHYILSFSLQIDLLSPQQEILIVIVIANISYYIGCIFFYILLVMRVYTGFKGTVYALSRWIFFFLWFLIITSIFASIWHISIMIFIQNEDLETKLKRPAFMILMLNDALLNIVLFILFIYKLRQISISTQSLSDDISNISFQTNKTLHIITRHCVLFGIAILSNQLFYTSGYIISFYPPTNNVLIGIVYQLRALENMINIMVLYLCMTLNSDLYQKLCSICHTQLMKCCGTSIQRRATEYYRLQSI